MLLCVLCDNVGSLIGAFCSLLDLGARVKRTPILALTADGLSNSWHPS